MDKVDVEEENSSVLTSHKAPIFRASDLSSMSTPGQEPLTGSHDKGKIESTEDRSSERGNEERPSNTQRLPQNVIDDFGIRYADDSPFGVEEGEWHQYFLPPETGEGGKPVFGEAGEQDNEEKESQCRSETYSDTTENENWRPDDVDEEEQEENDDYK